MATVANIYARVLKQPPHPHLLPEQERLVPIDGVLIGNESSPGDRSRRGRRRRRHAPREPHLQTALTPSAIMHRSEGGAGEGGGGGGGCHNHRHHLSSHHHHHWEAASAFYLLILTAVLGLFLCALLTHPPQDGGGKRPSKRSSSIPRSAAKVRPDVLITPPSHGRRRSSVNGRKELRTSVSCGDGVGGPTASQGPRPSECVPTDRRPPVADGAETDGATFLKSAEAVPGSTASERRRFLNARDGDVGAASEMLRKYLDWREEFAQLGRSNEGGNMRKKGRTDSETQWRRACDMASKSLSEIPATVPVPCILFWSEDEGGKPTTSLDGMRVLQHLPARIDTDVASGKFYALALAIFFDLTLDRESNEKFMVVIDTRPGTGWGNVPATKLVSFIKHAAALLNGLHPERLGRCILFPVPFWAKGLWNMIRPFLDPDTADKICLVSGAEKVDSPVPAKMDKHFDKAAIDRMEGKRLSCFAEEGPA